MGYHLLNGQWRKKVPGQLVKTSSSEDEEEDEEQPQEFTTTIALAQEEEIGTQELINITIEPSVPAPSAMDTPAPPTMDIPTFDTTQTPITEPSVSQSYFDNQMRQMIESITTSIGSMF